MPDDDNAPPLKNLIKGPLHNSIGLGKWIVCSAWPYINAVPHLGTFIHLLTADVYSRFLRLMKEDVISVSGSDEHGTPIEVEAIRQGITPKELTDKYHNLMLELLASYSIELDNYTRTESEIHIKFVQDFYRRIEKNGYVYTKRSLQLYCDNCERFLPDRFVEGECPYCGYPNARGDQCDDCGRLLEPITLKNPKCIICESIPIEKETLHWYFDLPAFENKVREFIHNNEQLPENAKNFSLRWLKEGLKERTLTRDNKWGIPAPFEGAEGKTIYVWMEAVLGYLSAVKEYEVKKGIRGLFERFWKDQDTKAVFFIGKDNIPFHTIVFPALLLAVNENYVLPWQVSSTEFILFEGMKFSKSRKIGIWMDEAKDIVDPEYWRFILMSIRPEQRDANFTWAEFEHIINNNLNDVIGNFVHRALSFVFRYMDSKVPSYSDFDVEDEQFIDRSLDLQKGFVSAMYNFKIREAIKLVVDFARLGNEYLSIKRPWEDLSKNEQRFNNTIYNVMQAVAHLALLLYPFMPKSSIKLLDMLNLKELKSSIHLIDEWEIIRPGSRIKKPVPLFHKVKAPKSK
jgi:methionyl-tRNA synthetase